MRKLFCKHCERYLGEAESIIGELICSNSKCKATNQFKILNNNQDKLLHHKFLTPERQPKGEHNE
jgi:phage FluMu protein Com